MTARTRLGVTAKKSQADLTTADRKLIDQRRTIGATQRMVAKAAGKAPHTPSAAVEQAFGGMVPDHHRPSAAPAQKSAFQNEQVAKLTLPGDAKALLDAMVTEKTITGGMTVDFTLDHAADVLGFSADRVRVARSQLEQAGHIRAVTNNLGGPAGWWVKL